MSDPAAHIKDPVHALRFLLAGNAHTTFVSHKTGARFTFHVEKNATPATVNAPSHFVSVLTGTDTYTYLGCIYREKFYVHGRRSMISQSAPSALAFAWVWGRLQKGRVPETCDVWHEGRCGRCGRRLTVPSSIESGLGPECARRTAVG